MPKVYDDELKGRGKRLEDMSVSARMARQAELKSLGFEQGSQALSPNRKDGFELSVSSGSFRPHVEQMWWIRKQASSIAKSMGKNPDPEVEKKTGGKGKPATKVWAEEVRQSGQLKANEETFTRMLKDLLGKLRVTFDALAYNRDFDMVQLKNMDRNTLDMYLARVGADVEEITQIYQQLVALLPMVEGASGAYQALNEAGSEVAQLRGDLLMMHRTFRQETMVIRAGGPRARSFEGPGEEE